MIENRKRFNQFIDYSGLMFGSIHPTDSDGEIEYHDKAWIFFEIKYREKYLPYGQQLALERKVNDIQKSGKETVLFVAQHDVENPEIDVDAAACIVRRIFYKGNWFDGDGATLKAYVLRFIRFVDSPPAFVQQRKSA